MIDVLKVINQDEWVDPISQEQEAELIAKAQAGDESATLALIKQYSPLIKRTVNGAGYMDKEDAVQEVLVEILSVIKSHDTDKHPRLAGRLSSALSGAVKEAGRKEQSQFKIPSGTVKRYNQILRAAEGKKEKALTLCSLYKMKPSTFLHIHNLINRVDSIDEVTNIAGSQMDSTIEDSLLCAYGFTSLTDEEEEVIKTSYGFSEVNVGGHWVWAEGHNPLSATIVSAAMDISTHRVKKLHSEALGKMREVLVMEEGDSVVVA